MQTILRVKRVALERIAKYGIETKIVKNEWDSTINIFDPDGNRVGVRGEATFQGLIEWPKVSSQQHSYACCCALAVASV